MCDLFTDSLTDDEWATMCKDSPRYAAKFDRNRFIEYLKQKYPFALDSYLNHFINKLIDLKS
jgi:hypothetical protein